MKLSIRTILGYFFVVALLFVMSFCSKPGNDPNPNQQPALISPSDANGVGAALIMPTGTETKAGNPPASSASAQAPKVTTSTTQINSTTGSMASVALSYSNLNGAVGGVYAQVQNGSTYFTIPLSGTAAAAGKITIPVGIPANLGNGSFTFVISLYDASGRVSNTVSITITIGSTTTDPTNDDPYKDGDPYAKDYFIEYYENGDFHSPNYTVSPVSFTYTAFTGKTNQTLGCKLYSGSLAYVGKSFDNNEFSLQFPRDGWDKLPEVGTYTFSQSSGGNIDLTIGTAYNCFNKPQTETYIKLNVTEVKVVKDYGEDKSGNGYGVFGNNIRGYFSGEFEALLVYAPIDPTTGNIVTTAKYITKGRFKLPMGGPNAKLNGTGTVIKADRMALLTAGKWYFNPSVLPDCLTDDYWQFRSNGTFDTDDGTKKCASGIADVKKLLNNSWNFTNDQKSIHLKFRGTYLDSSEVDFDIVELSETTLRLKITGEAGVFSLKRIP